MNKNTIFKLIEKDNAYFKNHPELQDQAEIALFAIKRHNNNFQYVADTLKQNQDFMRSVLRFNYNFIQYTPNNLRDNKELMEDMLDLNYGNGFQYISDRLKNDKEFVSRYIKNYNFNFSDIGESLKSNKSFILEVLQKNRLRSGFTIDFLDESLKRDQEVAKLALDINSKNLEYIDISLRDNKDFIAKYLKANAFIYQFLSDNLRADRNIALEVIDKNPYVLNFVSDELKKDWVLVKKAIAKQGGTLQYADKTLRSDFNLVKEAILQNGEAIVYAEPALRNNKELVLLAINNVHRIHDSFFEHLGEIKKDKEIVLEIIKKCNTSIITQLNDIIKDDIKMISSYLKSNFLHFQDIKNSPIVDKIENQVICAYRLAEFFHNTNLFSEHIVECIKNENFDDGFYQEINSQSFLNKFAIPKRNGDVPLAQTIAKNAKFLPSANIIARGKKVKELEPIYVARESEWISQLENISLTKCISDSRNDHMELARNDIGYFKKVNKYSRDPQFILDYIQSTNDIQNIPKFLLNKQDFYLKIILKLPESCILFKDKTIPQDIRNKAIFLKPNLYRELNAPLESIYKEYKETFLQNCIQSNDEGCIIFALSFEEFATQQLLKDPNYYQKSNFNLDDLYKKGGNEFLNKCFSNRQSDIFEFAMQHPNFEISEDNMENFKSHPEKKYYIYGVQSQQKKQNNLIFR